MSGMRSFLLALSVGAVLCFPAAAIVEALDAGGLGYPAALLVVMVVASLFDRERFYGTDVR